MESLPVVCFISTGGTIAAKVDPVKGVNVNASATLSGDDLMECVPGAAQYARIEVKDLSIVPLDIDNTFWIKLTRTIIGELERPEVAGVIVAQGTDTIEETAFWLDLTIKSDKPVIVIGAQRNASVPDFDGPRNILNAIRIAVCPEARGKGVMVGFNNQITAAQSVTKTHTGNVETFKGGDFGFLGEVWDDKVIFMRAPLNRMHIPVTDAAMPPVHIFPFYCGAEGTFIRHAVDKGAQGIIATGAGMGNMSRSMFEEGVLYAIEQSVPVVISTRVPNGRSLAVYGCPGCAKVAYDAGAIMSGYHSPQKAKILLTLLLHSGVRDTASLRRAFDP